MANFNQPALTDTYANFLAFLNAKLVDAAVGLDPAVTTVTNPPLHAIRYNSVANRWEKFNGTSYVVLSTGYAISITGNAATATTLATGRTINGVSFNGSANITVNASTTQAITFNSGGAGVTSGTTFDGGTARIISYNTVGAPSTTGANASGTWGISISGNAATATAANAGYFTAAATTPKIELHKPGVIAGMFYINGSNLLAFAQTGGNGTATADRLTLNIDNGNMTLGGGITAAGATISGSIAATGNITAEGDVTAFSDERLKQNWRDLPMDFLDRLARVKMGVYDRKDTGHTQVGVGAQSLRDQAMPMAVLEGAGGTLSVAYGNAALAACVALAREVLSLKAQVAELKG